jgi:hypothetical protein
VNTAVSAGLTADEHAARSTERAGRSAMWCRCADRANHANRRSALVVLAAFFDSFEDVARQTFGIAYRHAVPIRFRSVNAERAW